ncbi:MAG: 50S ribosomal protein L11 methyltransferase [Desulfatiglandales bacterium]
MCNKVKEEPPEFITVFQYEGKDPEPFKREGFMGLWKEGGQSFLFFRGDLSDERELGLSDYTAKYVFRYWDWVGGEFTTFSVGNFTIRPPWEPVTNPLEIVIDPSVVFGSGLHPTTRDCLSLIDRLPNIPQYALDLGTGTGILAIALARKGIRVIAVDNNPLCLEVASRNLALNKVGDSITLVEGDILSLELTFPELVVANLGPDIIRAILEKKDLRETKTLVLSGITRSFVGEIQDLMREAGFHISEHLSDHVWHTLFGEKDPIEY